MILKSRVNGPTVLLVRLTFDCPSTHHAGTGYELQATLPPLPLRAKTALSFGVCLENGPAVARIADLTRPRIFLKVSSDVDDKNRGIQ